MDDPVRGDLGDLGGAVLINGPGGPTRHWGVVHVGPADGVCSVDEIGCGYCIGVPCQQPKSSAESPETEPSR